VPDSPRADLPPAVAAVVDIALSLARRAPSTQIAVVRLGDLVDPETLRPEAREAFAREVEEARAATCEPLAFADVERVLREAWKSPPGKVLDDLDEEPLAVRPASQVHRGELDGTAVAIKVRRPGVERSVRNDVALLEALPTPLRAAFPNLDAVGVLRELREAALDELDFEHEASQQRRVARALRGVEGVTVPRPHLDLSTSDVLVSDLLRGETLAAGARPADPGAAARALVRAFRTAALEAGLAITDPRPSQILVGPGDELGLLGTGVARPVDRERAARALQALGALADGDEDVFVETLTGADVLGPGDAHTAYGIAREVAGELLDGPAVLDAAALRAAGGRAARSTGPLARLAMAASPHPADLALGRMLGQLVAVLARLGAEEDWAGLAR
jgi:hypothetical protein